MQPPSPTADAPATEGGDALDAHPSAGRSGLEALPEGLPEFQSASPATLLDLLDEVVLAFDADGRVVAASAAAEQLAGVPAGGLLGADCRAALPGSEACSASTRCLIHDALDRGRPAVGRRERGAGPVRAEASLIAGPELLAVVYRERPCKAEERLAAELAAARHAVDAANARASWVASRSDSLMRACGALRSARDPSDAATRAVDILGALPELVLMAVGLGRSGDSRTLVQGLVRRASGRLTPLKGRAVLLDLLSLSPERRRVSESFVLEGFHASVQSDSGLAAGGDWDLTLVFDGEPTAVTPLLVEGRSYGFLLTKPAKGVRVDEALMAAVELVARALASALDALRREESEGRRRRLASELVLLGRRLLDLRDPDRVLHEVAATLSRQWPRAAVEWMLLAARSDAPPAPRVPSLFSQPRIVRQGEGAAPQLLSQAPPEAQVFVPVRTAAGLRAQLTATAPDLEAFESVEMDDLQDLAKVVSAAFANAELFRREQRSLEGLAVVARIGRLSVGTLEATDALGAALAELCRHGSFETVAVSLLKRGRGKLVLRAQASRVGVRLPEELATAIELGLTGLCVREARCVLAADVRLEPAYHEVEAGTRSELCVPLRVLDRVVGVLDIQSRELGAFDEEDQVVAEAVADHLARALNDARLYAAVKSANRELRSSERRKTDFLATVAHDLRTPLTSIRSAAEVVLMYEGAPAEETNEFLVAIRDEAARLGRLVDDFLAQARIEGGDLEFEVVEFRLDEQLRHFARLFEGQATRRGITVSCHIPEDLPTAVGDPERVSQVVANLLSNATKFTLEGGEILLAARALPAEEGQVLGRVMVEVTDTGPGIEEQDRERIFERYVRIDSDPRAPRGAGLGLPIARSLVEHLGGRLWCDSGERRGSVFRFTLPALLDGAGLRTRPAG